MANPDVGDVLCRPSGQTMSVYRAAGSKCLEACIRGGVTIRAGHLLLLRCFNNIWLIHFEGGFINV